MMQLSLLPHIFVFIGAGSGGLLRYWLALATKRWWPQHADVFPPLPTLAVNVLGSLLIGVLAARLIDTAPEHPLRLLFIVGFCGGFTTFSSFSYDVLALLHAERYGLALIYSCVSVLSCLVAVSAGWYAVRS